MSLRPTQRLDPVTLVWVGGIVLAVLAYVVGPSHVVTVVLQALEQAAAFVRDLAHQLTSATIAVLRAAAIGLFGTFVGLTLLGLRRGGGGIGGLIVVSLLFLLLVWGADGEGSGSNLRWVAALVIAGLSALSATQRLRGGRG
jgi:hypothetical protein